MSRFDPSPPVLPSGLFARTLTLPVSAFFSFVKVAWPSAIALVLLDFWEPGRTWRSFGAGGTVFKISDGLFLIALIPMLLGWMAVAPSLFDGGRRKPEWRDAWRHVLDIPVLASAFALGAALLVGMSRVIYVAPLVSALVGAVLDAPLPIGTAGWIADGFRLCVLGVVFWAGLSLADRVSGGATCWRSPGIGWLPRCLMAAFVFGVLHELAGGTLVPIVAEALARIDITLAQGCYRLLGGVFDLLLPAWAVGYIAVIAAARSRAEALD